MTLTPENKATIDSKSLFDLFVKWRFAPVGDPWMQGETGEYWGKRMAELRAQDNGAWVQASKSLG